MARSFAKFLLVTLVVLMFVTTFTNLAMFFPWFLSLQYEVSSLGMQAAEVNFLEPAVANATKARLANHPFFGKSEVKIESTRDSMSNKADEGEVFHITLYAKFPFEFKLGNRQISYKTDYIPFPVRVVGSKFYR